jgi:hypothetical protein
MYPHAGNPLDWNLNIGKSALLESDVGCRDFLDSEGDVPTHGHSRHDPDVPPAPFKLPQARKAVADFVRGFIAPNQVEQVVA